MRNIDSAIGKIFQGDALSFMRELPGESFDLAICDGPYAVTTHKWDNVPDIQHFNLELLKSFFPAAQTRWRGLSVRQTGLRGFH